jgi:hypothetical protein
MATMTETAVRHRAPQAGNSHGKSARNWAAAESVTLTGIEVQGVSSREAEARPEVTHVLYAALTADVEAADRITYTDPRGKTRVYEVDGEPIWFNGASPFTRHIEAHLKAVD